MIDTVKPASNSYNIKIIGCECGLDRLEDNTFYIRQLWYNPNKKEPPKDRPFLAKVEECYWVIQYGDCNDRDQYFTFGNEAFEKHEIERWTEIPNDENEHVEVE